MEQVNIKTTEKAGCYVVLCGTPLSIVSKAAFPENTAAFPEKVLQGHHAKPSVLQDYFSLILQLFI